MKIINRLIPICGRTPMKLLKYRKIYNARRHLYGSDHEFACTGRIASIPSLQFYAPPIPASLTKMYHVCQKDMMHAPVLHHQAISNAHIHAGSWQNQCIHEECICIEFIGTGRSNLWSDFDLHETQIVAASPTDAMFAARFHDRLHFLNPTYP